MRKQEEDDAEFARRLHAEEARALRNSGYLPVRETEVKQAERKAAELAQAEKEAEEARIRAERAAAALAAYEAAHASRAKEKAERRKAKQERK